MSTERFEHEMFGNWAGQAEKFQAFKQEQNRNRQKYRTKNFETIEEESYINPENTVEDKTNDDDDANSTSSYQSTETILDQ